MSTEPQYVRSLRTQIDALRQRVDVQEQRIRNLLTERFDTPVKLPWALRPAERRLLVALAKAGPQGVSMERAAAVVNSHGVFAGNVVAVNVSRVRAAVAPSGVVIETSRKIGYVIIEGLSTVRQALKIKEDEHGD